MLTNVKSWILGDEEETVAVRNEAAAKSDEEVNPKEQVEEKELDLDQQMEEDLKKVVSTAKEWGSYFFSVGKKATNYAAKQVVDAAKLLKDQVEDIPAPLNAPQELSLPSDTRWGSVEGSMGEIPWRNTDGTDNQELRAALLDLSAREETFLTGPEKNDGAGDEEFEYTWEENSSIAVVLLKEDPHLRQSRFELVPKRVREEIFWRNYFFHVSQVKRNLHLGSSDTPLTPGSVQPSDPSTALYDRLSDLGEETIVSDQATTANTQDTSRLEPETVEKESDTEATRDSEATADIGDDASDDFELIASDDVADYPGEVAPST